MNVKNKKTDEISNEYKIIDKIEFGTSKNDIQGFILTKKIDKEEYATWMKMSRGYVQEHYGFTSRESAFLDLVERSSREVGLNLGGVYADQVRENDIQHILSCGNYSSKEVDTIMKNKEFCYRSMNRIDSHDFSGINEELLCEIENVIYDMVQEGRLFTQNFHDALNENDVTITLRDGNCVQGIYKTLENDFFAIYGPKNKNVFMGELKDVQTISQKENVLYARGKPQFVLTVCVTKGDVFVERKTMSIDENHLSSKVYRDAVRECLKELNIRPNDEIYLESEIVDNRDSHSRHDEVSLSYKEAMKMFYENCDYLIEHEY